MTGRARRNNFTPKLKLKLLRIEIRVSRRLCDLIFFDAATRGEFVCLLVLERKSGSCSLTLFFNVFVGIVLEVFRHVENLAEESILTVGWWVRGRVYELLQFHFS